jgi:adenylate cyclase
VGFTPLAEKLPPAEVARLLNRVFEKFTDIIFRHEGTLDKYLGDAVMAVFGAPMDSQRHAVQAVRAAFEMLDAIKGLNETSGGSPLLQFHFGINSGPVVAGDIGSPRRKEYTVLGNTVNTAARIQAGSPPDAIWVGPQTYEAVKEVVTARKVGEEKFKGLAKPIPIYHLESIRPLQDEETHETQC